MARRKSDSPQKAAMREMMQGYLKENGISIKSGNDVNSIMRDMMSVLLEGALDEELYEELGYSKYDYRNKETDNSWNGHSKKTMRTSYGINIVSTFDTDIILLEISLHHFTHCCFLW